MNWGVWILKLCFFFQLQVKPIGFITTYLYWYGEDGNGEAEYDEVGLWEAEEVAADPKAKDETDEPDYETAKED